MLDAAINRSIRRPRFRRCEEAPPFQLTERDIEIVREVERHRFLRSTHVSLLLDAPHKKICERLTHLYHAGYLDRPRSQLEYHVHGGGSAHYVYALGNRGAGLLKECGGAAQGSVNWERKNRDSTRQFLLHALSVAEFRVALAVSCRSHPELRLLEADDLLQSAPEPLLREPNPWHWRVRVQRNGQSTDIGVIPDYAFALILPDGRRRPFVVECDRGTMPIERGSLTQTSILRKLLAYEATRARSILNDRFGWKNFRVLVSTTSEERLGNMRELARRCVANSPLFLFAGRKPQASPTFLNSLWENADGAITSLI
jgi:hypothetical protein